MSQALAETVDTLARPIADEFGIEVLDVDVRGIGGARVKILVTVDVKGGVDVGTCQKVSKQLARALEDKDPTMQRYTLEVSSPGTSRPLVDQGDFDRAEGKKVTLTMREDVADADGEPGADSADGASDLPAELTGTIGRADPDTVAIHDADGRVHDVPYAAIARAVQVVRW